MSLRTNRMPPRVLFVAWVLLQACKGACAPPAPPASSPHGSIRVALDGGSAPLSPVPRPRGARTLWRADAGEGHTGRLRELLGASPRPLPGADDGPQSPGSPPLLPNVVGAAATEVSGCLARPGRLPLPGPTLRRADPDRLEVAAVSGGLRVAHTLSHACCLAAQVLHEVRGRQVVLREVLSGTPCRCLCRSTLQTAIALPPGPHQLTVHLVQAGEEREIHRARAVVPAPMTQ